MKLLHLLFVSFTLYISTVLCLDQADLDQSIKSSRLSAFVGENSIIIERSETLSEDEVPVLPLQAGLSGIMDLADPNGPMDATFLWDFSTSASPRISIQSEMNILVRWMDYRTYWVWEDKEVEEDDDEFCFFDYTPGRPEDPVIPANSYVGYVEKNGITYNIYNFRYRFYQTQRADIYIMWASTEDVPRKFWMYDSRDADYPLTFSVSSTEFISVDQDQDFLPPVEYSSCFANPYKGMYSNNYQSEVVTWLTSDQGPLEPFIHAQLYSSIDLAGFAEFSIVTDMNDGSKHAQVTVNSKKEDTWYWWIEKKVDPCRESAYRPKAVKILHILDERFDYVFHYHNEKGEEVWVRNNQEPDHKTTEEVTMSWDNETGQAHPVRYSLYILGSHKEIFRLEYSEFQWKDIDESVFNTPTVCQA